MSEFIWVQVQAQPTLMNAKDTARKLLARIDEKERKDQYGYYKN